jgi:hypothetical protein
MEICIKSRIYLLNFKNYFFTCQETEIETENCDYFTDDDMVRFSKL